MLRHCVLSAMAAAVLSAALAGCVSTDQGRSPVAGTTGSLGAVPTAYAPPPKSSGTPWSGRSGASGHPTMSAEAIRTSAAQFHRCIEGLWPQAARRGISRPAFDQHASGLTPDLRIMDFMDSQPEFTKAIWDYLDVLVSEARIQKGRQMLGTHRAAFDAVERAYGVDRHIIAAIWGVETNYGAIAGDRPVLRSTATLACVGRRQAYFREEFLSALEIVARGDVHADRLKGSWAGAFGATQFMPTTFKQHAVDFDGDGRRDIVDTVPDMIASTANKLKKAGWEPGQTWGYEVTVPRGFDYMLADKNRHMAFGQWEKLGVRRVGGQPFPRAAASAFLLVPAGARGPAFLMQHNFQALMQYNPAEAYALAIGHLADRMRGGGPFVQPWPREEQILSRSERLELQKKLAHKGLYAGDADGRLGGDTRVAIRRYQASVGLTPDGFASGTILARLRAQ